MTMRYHDWEALRRAVERLDEHKLSVLIRVAESLGRVGPRAADLVNDVAVRLQGGISYGDWSPADGRNLANEARDEATDGVDYTTEELRRAKARVRALEAAQAAFIAAHEACIEAAE